MMLLLGTAWMVWGVSAAVIPETDELRLAHASNDLAFELLRSYKDEQNVFISPFSISTALALVYLGADGSTARVMRNVLKYDQYSLSRQEVHDAFQALLNKLDQNSDDYQLSSYNGALIQQNFSVLDRYQNDLSQYYSAQIERVDFANDGEKIMNHINEAVENATKGKIKDFLNEPLDPDTKLFLLNAVYFLGNWKTPFNPESTSEGTFYNNGVDEKEVLMMSRDDDYRFSSRTQLNASVVVLPYRGDHSASMIILLPDNRTGVVDLEQQLTQNSLNSVIESTRLGRLILEVPKFNLTYSTNLVEPLTSLGLGEIFGNGADLSGMAGEGSRLKVSSVVHKAVIDVNEEGTEAGGATGIEISPASLPPVIVIDHPFLFFIRDDSSGIILFAGRVDHL